MDCVPVAAPQVPRALGPAGRADGPDGLASRPRDVLQQEAHPARWHADIYQSRRSACDLCPLALQRDRSSAEGMRSSIAQFCLQRSKGSSCNLLAVCIYSGRYETFAVHLCFCCVGAARFRSAAELLGRKPAQLPAGRPLADLALRPAGQVAA